jgi:uncharacterized protein
MSTLPLHNSNPSENLTGNNATQRPKVLITGASTGIGKSFAYLYASQGRDLLLVSLKPALLKQCASELREKFSVDIQTVAVDLSAPKSAEKIANFVTENNWVIDILVNNAGVAKNRDFADTSHLDIQNMMAINMNAVVDLTYFILPQMLQRKQGEILNVASTAAFSPGPGMAIYFATKSFVLSFSQALACEVKDKGIQVTALCPGPTTNTQFAMKADLQKSFIHRGMVPMWEASGVARWGVWALKNKKNVSIVGFVNRICSYLSFYMPTKWVMGVIKKLH